MMTLDQLVSIAHALPNLDAPPGSHWNGPWVIGEGLASRGFPLCLQRLLGTHDGQWCACILDAYDIERNLPYIADLATLKQESCIASVIAHLTELPL